MFASFTRWSYATVHTNLYEKNERSSLCALVIYPQAKSFQTTQQMRDKKNERMIVIKAALNEESFTTGCVCSFSDYTLMITLHLMWLLKL